MCACWLSWQESYAGFETERYRLMIRFRRVRQISLLGLCLVLAACLSSHPRPAPDSTPKVASVATIQLPHVAVPTLTPVMSGGFSPSPVSPSAITMVPGPTLSSQPDSSKCQQPPDDYTRVKLNGQTINARTLWMLQRATTLYSGRGSPLNVIQGSYTSELAASFGTHAGGGAVDISVRIALTSSVVLSATEQLDLVRALRAAGFAAWLRLPTDLKPPVALHIHAIAIGDKELSEAARQQLDGPEGYFRGDDGIPPPQGGPHQDRFGGPIICDWMRRFGFTDLR